MRRFALVSELIAALALIAGCAGALTVTMDQLLARWIVKIQDALDRSPRR